MKKSTLAVLVMSLMASQTTLAAEIYNKNGNKLDLTGRLKALHYFSDNKAEDGDKTYARLGFKGETQINDRLAGYGRWEYQVAANKTESDADAGKTRLAFAGLKAGEYGSFDYGRNYGILYDIAAGTDILPEFGGDGLVKTDNFMTGRTTGVATYRNTDLFGLVEGLKLGVQYQGKNENRAAGKQNGDGFGTSLGYDIGDSGISLGLAYANSNRTKDQQAQYLSRDSKKAEAWGSSLRYDQNRIYLAAMYAEARHMTPVSGTAVINNVPTRVSGAATKNQVFEAVAQYQFDFGLRPSLSYVQSKGKKMTGVGDADLIKYIDVGATYYFNKNMSTYIDYKINQLKSDNKLGLNSDDAVALGLVYQF